MLTHQDLLSPRRSQLPNSIQCCMNSHMNMATLGGIPLYRYAPIYIYIMYIHIIYISIPLCIYLTTNPEPNYHIVGVCRFMLYESRFALSLFGLS
jgi:hypothetical protein